MSESFVDRILVGPSIDGNGPLTRSLYETQTSGIIRADAAHWSIEPYIPLAPSTLIEYLIGRGELKPGHERPFRECCDHVDKILQERSASNLARFVEAYSPVDPDADFKVPISLASSRTANKGDGTGESLESQVVARTVRSRPADQTIPAAETNPADQQGPPTQAGVEADDPLEQRVSKVVSICDQILSEAGFRRLKIDEITSCVGVVSQFGVPLHVDLEIFQQLAVFARRHRGLADPPQIAKVLSTRGGRGPSLSTNGRDLSASC